MSATASLPVEASHEPLVGWRTWFVRPDEVLLRPIVMQGLAWRPAQVCEAVCPEELHEVPAEDCRCGVYAVCHPLMLREAVDDERRPGVLVVGQVALWGRVLEHERGWRAQYAYPKQLYAFTDDAALAGRLRDRYRVPVAHGPEAEALRKLLPRPRPAPPAHAPAATGSPTPAGQPGPGTVGAALWNLTEPYWRPTVGEAGMLQFYTHWLRPFVWSYAVGGAKEHVKCKRATLDGHYRSLQRALIRGSYYGKPGVGWLREATARERREFTLNGASVRAARGSERAARRLVWSALVNWWRPVCGWALDEVVRRREALEQDRQCLASGRRRDGRPYAVASLAGVRARIRQDESTLAEKEAALGKLVTIQLPTYREWCAGALDRGLA